MNNTITILYEAFGKPCPMQKDWGYSAFIEYNGKRILFDTGNNAGIFKHNVEVAGVDLKKLDFAVVSHRHGDHTTGLNHLVNVSPEVKIYTPAEISGFGTTVLPAIIVAMNRHDSSLPPEMHYFDGIPQEPRPSGNPWPTAHFVQIERSTEIAPGVYILSTLSDVSGSKEMYEISLALGTPEGLVIVVGCSHAGIENILQEAARFNNRIHAVFGGFHLMNMTDEQVLQITTGLHDRWKIDRIGPGHCSGVPAFSHLRNLYKEEYLYAGLGSVIPLP